MEEDMDFNLIEKAFKDYVDNFDIENDNIKLKYYHTLEVARICYEVASKMTLTDEDKDLAKLIGYLHDIGRFEQVSTTNSFKDGLVDHADNGVKLLFDEGLIRKFISDNSYDSIIKKAIVYHNKYQVGSDLDSKELLMANIIRDCDKIDILRVRSEKYNDAIKVEPSIEVIDSIRKRESVKLSDIKNKSDSILCVLAFIFDFNYKESIEVLKEYGYYHKLLNNIEVDLEYKEMFEEVKKIVLERFEV